MKGNGASMIERDSPEEEARLAASGASKIDAAAEATFKASGDLQSMIDEFRAVIDRGSKAVDQLEDLAKRRLTDQGAEFKKLFAELSANNKIYAGEKPVISIQPLPAAVTPPTAEEDDEEEGASISRFYRGMPAELQIKHSQAISNATEKLRSILVESKAQFVNYKTAGEQLAAIIRAGGCSKIDAESAFRTCQRRLIKSGVKVQVADEARRAGVLVPYPASGIRLAEYANIPAGEKEDDMCLFPSCGRKGRKRGLCDEHFAQADTAVRDGRVSWARLEAVGKAKPWVQASSKNEDFWTA